MTAMTLRVFEYQEGKQLIMRALFGAISTLYLLIGHFNDTFIIPAPALKMVTIGYFIAIGITFVSILRWPESLLRRLFNICVDVLAATVVIYYTGGASSPAFLLYVWLLTSNAMRFRMREVYVSQAASLLAYSFVLYSNPDGITHPVQVAFQFSTLLIFPIYLHKLIAIQGKARKLAEESNRTKSQFLANMSHELRTPLNAIIGYSELMQEDAIEQKHERYSKDLGHVLRSSWHLLDLINDVLNIAKIESGKMGVEYQVIELPIFLQNIADTIDPEIRKHQNRLITRFDQAPESIHTDPDKLKQILLNLLSNATKFTDNGEIYFTADRQHISGIDYLRIVIKDTGIGITQEQQQAIFEPFVQADGSTTRSYGGTGLGLSISKQFTQLLGGSIYLSSQPGLGSSFHIMLPLQASAPA